MAEVVIVGGGRLSAMMKEVDIADPAVDERIQELSLITRTIHTPDDVEKIPALSASLVEVDIADPAVDERIQELSLRHAGIIDPDTGERTPTYGVEGDVIWFGL